jgi:hypothetical protein
MALSPIAGGLSPAQIAAIQALRAQTAPPKAQAVSAPQTAEAPAAPEAAPRGGRGQIINITV